MLTVESVVMYHREEGDHRETKSPFSGCLLGSCVQRKLNTSVPAISCQKLVGADTSVLLSLRQAWPQRQLLIAVGEEGAGLCAPGRWWDQKTRFSHEVRGLTTGERQYESAQDAFWVLT